MIVAPPWSLVFGYHGESVSFLLLAFAAALSISLAALTLAQSIGFYDALRAAAVAIAHALFSVLARKAMSSPQSKFDKPPRGEQATDLKSENCSEYGSIITLLRKVLTEVTKIAVISALFVLPTVLLSGELGDMNRNCYLLDAPRLWYRIAAGSALQGASLLFFLLSANILPPFSLTFLQIPIYGVAFLFFCSHRLSMRGWISVGLCIVFTVVLASQKMDGSLVTSSSGRRGFWGLALKVSLAVVLYGAIYQGSYILEKYVTAGSLPLPSFTEQGPYGNARTNASLTELLELPQGVHDDYLEPRPTAGTFADISKIMTNCAQVTGGTGVDDIVHCLSYLASSQEEYLISPINNVIKRALGPPSPNPEEYRNSDDSRVSTHQHADNRPTSIKGVCSGPTKIFHTYWTGHATWRFELFIKAYIYTQDLSCSRLWIWLDTDTDQSAIDTMLNHDPAFQSLRSLYDDDYIVLQEWSFPRRIALPRASNGEETSILHEDNYPDTDGEVAIADCVTKDAEGQLWLIPNPIYKTVTNPTQISDFVRFVVLHLHGGVYLDMDVLLLRDFRPLLLPNSASGDFHQPAWAEQWVERGVPGDYNTAVLSLSANSSLTSYLLRGGMRMGMNFHPRIIGRMLWKDGRDNELTMLQTALFDPSVTNLRRKGTNICTVPCHKNFQSSFMGVVDEPENEWSNFKGDNAGDRAKETAAEDGKAGTNRTMENFFRGSFAYHIHNQVGLDLCSLLPS